jgi:hypothetical protein
MRKILLIWLLLLLMGAAGLGLGYVSAQGGAYDLHWYSVDGGGAKSTNNSYAVNGSIGQPDAGNLSNGAYALQGGFWEAPGASANYYHLYLPLAVKEVAGP